MAQNHKRVKGKFHLFHCSDCDKYFKTRAALVIHERTAKVHNSPAPVPASSVPNDFINPNHYKGAYVMCIIEDFKLGFKLGNVVKYVLREAEKGGLEDLQKAKWYLDREIEERKLKTIEQGRLNS